MFKKPLLALIIFLFSCSLSAQETHWYDDKPDPSWARFEKIPAGQDWYETYRIADDTYAILAPYHWQETISYLLIGSEKALLVDTGMGIGNIKLTVDQITTLPVIVVNTHSHYDHVSNNHHFDTVYGRNLDFTAKNASGHVKETYENAIQPSAIWKNLPDDFSYEDYQSKPFKITKYIEDGEKIDLGNRRVEIIFTPGHTPDSLLVFDREKGLLMTGDTFYPSTLWAHRADADYRDYLNSAKLMAALEKDVKYLLPGHGETIVRASFLSDLYNAFIAIGDPKTPYTLNNNIRRYRFDGFGALIKNPPE
jgi:glyoxylase-like metal-dependent hydrolase (beta-lactamase superfamily II)